MKRFALCALLILLCITAQPARAAIEPPIFIDITAPAFELSAGQPFTLTVVIFSSSVQTETVGLRQELDPIRFDLISISATRGDYEPIIVMAQGQPDRTVGVRWFVEVSADHPVLLSVKLEVRAAAPAGQVELLAHAANANQAEASAHETVRICCYHAPPPQQPVYRRFLPVARR